MSKKQKSSENFFSQITLGSNTEIVVKKSKDTAEVIISDQTQGTEIYLDYEDAENLVSALQILLKQLPS